MDDRGESTGEALPEDGDHRFCEDRPHLSRHPGQENDEPVGSKIEEDPGCGAQRVLQRHGALRHQGLRPVGGGKLGVAATDEPLLEAGQEIRVFREISSKVTGHGGKGQVVTGGPESSGDHHQVGHGQGRTQGRLDACLGVRAGESRGDRNTQGSQLPAQPRRVGVYGLARQQLVPHCDQDRDGRGGVT
jgi:hypothetical protein